MKVAIHAATLRGFGSSNVGRNIIRELARLSTGHTFEAWTPQDWGEELGDTWSNLVVHLCKSGIARKFITENIAIRRALAHEQFDCLLSLGDTSFPGCPVPHVLMVQQAFLGYPRNEQDFPVTMRFRLKMVLMEQYFRATLPTVSMLSVQTQSMKRRIARRWGFPEERIAVIPSSVTIPRHETLAHLSNDQAAYICYVATAAPHKNHIVLADVMAALARRGLNITCMLTVTRESVPDLVGRAVSQGVEHCFQFCGNVPSALAIVMMANAVATVIPSKLESFGLPYYEAMAVGCPVVAADRDFAREACGDAGLYANADDGRALASHVINLVEFSTYREEISQRVKQQFARVNRSWSAVAADYLNLLEEIVHGPLT